MCDAVDFSSPFLPSGRGTSPDARKPGVLYIRARQASPLRQNQGRGRYRLRGSDSGRRAGVVPRRRGLVQVAALGGAILIALQLGAGYWLYSYIVWFFPLVAVALFGSFPSEIGQALAAAVERRVETPPVVAAGAP